MTFSNVIKFYEKTLNVEEQKIFCDGNYGRMPNDKTINKRHTLHFRDKNQNKSIALELVHLVVDLASHHSTMICVSKPSNEFQMTIDLE